MKKGVKSQAGIIVVIILILLSFASFVLIANFIISFTKERFGKTSIDVLKIKLDVKEIVLDRDNSKINVKIHRGTGGGKIDSMKVIVYYSDGSTEVKDLNTNMLQEIETKNYELSGINFNGRDLKRIGVIPVVGVNNGVEIIGKVGSGVSGGNQCVPNCQGKVCGEDGCGSSCGSCQIGQSCSNGQCVIGCFDIDLDGYDTCAPGATGDDGKPADCNDNNADVNPGKIETCNGIDDNCNDQIDENNGNCEAGKTCYGGICVINGYDLTCYQESADNSDTKINDGNCGQDYSGSYQWVRSGGAYMSNPTYGYDGDWNTYTENIGTRSGEDNALYANYFYPEPLGVLPPKSSFYGSKVKIKDSSSGIPREIVLLNECFRDSGIVLYLYFNPDPPAQYHTEWYCFDNNNNLIPLYQDINLLKLYEEGIVWQIEEVLPPLPK